MAFNGAAIILLTVWLLQCRVPNMRAVAGRAPVAGTGARGAKIRIVTRFHDVHHCKDKAHSFFIRNTSNHLEKDGTDYVDADFDLTTTARRLIVFKYIVHRCPIDVGGKCEYYSTRSWNMAVCKLVTANGMVWSPLVQNIHPPFKCPMLKGFYQGRNMTVDVASYGIMLEGLEVDKYAWQFEVQVSSESGLYICLNLIGQVRRVRVKEN